MPLPPDLRFTDRLAQHGKRWYILCSRSGHARMWKPFKHRSDATAFLAAHDTAYHNASFRHVGFKPELNVTIPQLAKEWLAHIRDLEREGIRSPDTVRYHELMARHLVDSCRAAQIRTARDITPQRLGLVARWFRTNTKTKGASTEKALSALKSWCRWKAIPCDWQIPHDEIRTEETERLDFDADMIRKVVARMPEGSIEQACAYLKARTGAHDVEIYQAKREEFDLDVELDQQGRVVQVGVFRPMLRKKGGRSSKRRRKRHVYVITSDAVEKIRPFVQRAAPGEYVFTVDDGRPLTREDMRPRIRAASKKAGLTKVKKESGTKKDGTPKTSRIGALDSLAQIRAEVITLVSEELSLKEAADHTGHDDPSTTEQWYVKDRVTTRKLLDKLRPAEIIANALPLSQVVN